MVRTKIEAWQELNEQERMGVISLKGSERKKELEREILELLPNEVEIRITVEDYDCERDVEWWHPEIYKIPKEKLFDDEYLMQEVEEYVEVDYNDWVEFAVLDVSWELKTKMEENEK